MLLQMYMGTPAWRRHEAEDADERIAGMRALMRGQQHLQFDAECPPELKDLVDACVNADPQVSAWALSLFWPVLVTNWGSGVECRWSGLEAGKP